MRLDDATKKMSKSDKTNKGIIFLTDTPDMIDKKIMKAKTDSNGKVTKIKGFDFNRLHIKNLGLNSRT